MLLEYVYFSSRRQLDVPPNSCVSDLYSALLETHSHLEQIPILDNSNYYVTCNGKRVDKNALLEDRKTYHFVPRLIGGKGGFGSMLRAIGAQIEKTTSREACRDLSGRRMRDINNEKKLKEWLAKEAEREQEREERKKDRLAKHLRSQHKFDDEDYHEQKAKVQEDLQDALSTGLKRKLENGDKKSGATQDKKPKPGKASKAEWLGIELDSDDLCSSDSDMEANPGDPNPSSSSQFNSDSQDNRLASSQSDGEKDLNGEEVKPLISDKSSHESTEGKLQVQSNQLPSNSDSSHSLLTSLPMPTSTVIKIEKTDEMTSDIPSDTPVILEDFNSNSELQVLGLDRLKHALMARGLKCGGTLEERAARLMTVKGLSPEEIQASHPALLAKSGGKGGKAKKSK